ncbi:MAG: Gfo/Idh/MocA family oxidoreductase [Candidatus Omnitrophica bacterium]|nr:Gfo/Idh/MocA family oxidoreductase [Candidatus Omnitrophota bacterium]
MVTIACIGAGNWGKNLIRNFSELPEARLKWICDVNENRLREMQRLYPSVRLTTRSEEIFRDPEVDGCIIASSARTHYALAFDALSAKKHVFIEKPMTLNSGDARELITLAATQDVRLMVGHLLLYHPAVQKLQNLIQKKELGDIFYIYSQRVNLGQVRSDENALWSFAPHDISVILYLLGETPDNVSARGGSYLRSGIHDVVFVHMHFPDGKTAQIQLSWLDPHKERKLTIVGSQKMAVFDDMQPAEKIRVYDKGANIPKEYDSYGDAITLRFGDIVIPRVNMTEPLKIECQHFLDCIQQSLDPISDGTNGLHVVRILEAAQISLEKNGVPVDLMPVEKGDISYVNIDTQER